MARVLCGICSTDQADDSIPGRSLHFAACELRSLRFGLWRSSFQDKVSVTGIDLIKLEVAPMKVNFHRKNICYSLTQDGTNFFADNSFVCYFFILFFENVSSNEHNKMKEARDALRIDIVFHLNFKESSILPFSY